MYDKSELKWEDWYAWYPVKLNPLQRNGECERVFRMKIYRRRTGEYKLFHRFVIGYSYEYQTAGHFLAKS